MAHLLSPDPRQAFKVFRNYDGSKSTFGDVSVSTSVPDPDQMSAFAALRSSDNALTLVVVNKALSGSTPISVTFANVALGTSAQVCAGARVSAELSSGLAGQGVSCGLGSAHHQPSDVVSQARPGPAGV